jgi:ATP-dependent Zn protease
MRGWSGRIWIYRENTGNNFGLKFLNLNSEIILSIIDAEYKRAQGILLDRRAMLDKLSNALLQHKTIEGSSVYELVKMGIL